jgi:hypothetical protein
MSHVRVLTIEQYGEVLACLHHFASEGFATVLAAFALDDATWVANDARWVHELAEAKARGQALAAMRFASAHGRARKRLARGELDLAGAVRAAGMEPAQSPSDGSRAVPRSGDAPALATPSFMKEDAAPTPPRGTDGPHQELHLARDVPLAASKPPTNDVSLAPARRAPVPTGPMPVAGGPVQLPFRAAGPAAASPPSPRPLEPRVNTGTLLVEDDAAARSAIATPIPVERYASLVVELRLPGANRAEVLGRHALGGEEELAKLQGAFRQAFLADPGLRARYEALVMRISAERR